MDKTQLDQTSAPRAAIEDVYLVFEGGGAKALAYIGAMRALEDSGRIWGIKTQQKENQPTPIKGVAGTSGGAIVAALVAAGYRSRDLFDWDAPAADRKLLDFDLIDVIDKRSFERWRKSLLAWERIWRSWPKYEPAPQDQSSDRFAKRMQSTVGEALVRATKFASALPLIWRIPILLWSHGAFATDGFERWLEQMLRAKVPVGEGAGELVRFSQLPRLKVIATNLTNPGTEVFEYKSGPPEKNPHVSQAVSASIAIPFVFKPVELKGQSGTVLRFVDGGVTSNLPYWLFLRERERTADYGTPIIAFRAVDARPPEAPPSLPPKVGDFRPFRRPSLMNHVQQLVSAAIIGTEGPDQGPIGNLFFIELPVDVGTLDLNLGRTQRVTLAKSGYNAVRDRLASDLALGPKGLIETILKYYHARALELRTPAHRQEGERLEAREPSPDSLRLSVLAPVNQDHHMVVFGHNMDGHPDQSLCFPMSEGAAGSVYKSKQYQAIKLETAPENFAKGRRAMIRQGLKTLALQPIFGLVNDQIAVKGILAADSIFDEFEIFSQPEFKTLMEEASLQIWRAVLDTIPPEIN